MIKASLGAVGVIVALALVIPSGLNAFGASRTVGAGGGPSSTPPASSTPGSPSDPGGGPPGGGGPGNPGGNGGDLPTPPPEEQIAQLEETCNGALATLVKIPERMVVAFGNGAGVNVIPVCNSGLGKTAAIDASQALPLQDAISNNPELMGALKTKGFTADDVVGVVLLDGAATLYVHKKA